MNDFTCTAVSYVKHKKKQKLNIKYLPWISFLLVILQAEIMEPK